MTPFTTTFTSEKCGFSIKLPGKPREEVKPVNKNTELESWIVHSVSKHGASYRVDCYEYKNLVNEEDYIDFLIADILRNKNII